MINNAIKSYGTESVEMALSGLILLTAEYFNVQGNISKNQAVMIAGDLIQKHSLENIEDIILALQNIRTSGNKLWGKFDAQTIFESMDLILDQKIDEREKVQAKAKEEHYFPAQRSGDPSKAFRELHHEALKNYLQEKTK